MHQTKAIVAKLAIAAVLSLGLSGLAATPALADYGNTAVYQIEISANTPGRQGGGVWLWIELSNDGTGTYAGADCGHGFGAVSDKGDVTWVSGGGVLTITGVVLNGLGGLPVTITVPSTFGHYPKTIFQVFGIPFPGLPVQVQVAP